jgi:hypothetical protein
MGSGSSVHTMEIRQQEKVINNYLKDNKHRIEKFHHDNKKNVHMTDRMIKRKLREVYWQSNCKSSNSYGDPLFSKFGSRHYTK